MIKAIFDYYVNLIEKLNINNKSIFAVTVCRILDVMIVTYQEMVIFLQILQ